MREKPVPGTRYFAGTLLGGDGQIGRHIAVRFQCAHCKDGVGRIRFSHLKATPDKEYQTKSCGCLKRARFDQFHRDWASRMYLSKARQIFTSYSSKPARETATTFGITSYVANYAWQRWCRVLESLPETHRHEVYTVRQASWQTALAKFDHNVQELRWICRHWRRGRAAEALRDQASAERKAECRAHALHLFAQYAPVGSLTGSIYEDVCLYMGMAIADARRPGFNPGRYFGELTQRELAKVRRSDYAWVFETLQLMYELQVMDCFGQPGVDFLDVCRTTVQGRRQRRAARIVLVERGLSLKKCPAVAAAQTAYHYLPRPEARSDEIALVIVEHRPALREAWSGLMETTLLNCRATSMR
jgi:hypothetical protein